MRDSEVRPYYWPETHKVTSIAKILVSQVLNIKKNKQERVDIFFFLGLQKWPALEASN